MERRYFWKVNAMFLPREGFKKLDAMYCYVENNVVYEFFSNYRIGHAHHPYEGPNVFSPDLATGPMFQWTKKIRYDAINDIWYPSPSAFLERVKPYMPYKEKFAKEYRDFFENRKRERANLDLSAKPTKVLSPDEKAKQELDRIIGSKTKK